jgi:peroxiredoxin
MKKINIRLRSLLILAFTGLFVFNSCVLKKETYQYRVSKCFKAADKTEFTIQGSDEKGISIGNAEPSCILGVPLPEFEIADIDNNRIRTKDLKGKINIINFWFKACVPCVAEIPDLNILYKKYKSKEINFIAITTDSTSEIVNFLKKHPFDFTIIPNGNDLFRKKFQLMWGYPFTIITNKKNVIIGAIKARDSKNHSSGSIINEIESILAGQGL